MKQDLLLVRSGLDGSVRLVRCVSGVFPYIDHEEREKEMTEAELREMIKERPVDVVALRKDRERIAGLEDKIRYLVSEKRNRTFIDEGWNAALEEVVLLVVSEVDGCLSKDDNCEVCNALNLIVDTLRDMKREEK